MILAFGLGLMYVTHMIKIYLLLQDLTDRPVPGPSPSCWVTLVSGNQNLNEANRWLYGPDREPYFSRVQMWPSSS